MVGFGDDMGAWCGGGGGLRIGTTEGENWVYFSYYSVVAV